MASSSVERDDHDAHAAIEQSTGSNRKRDEEIDAKCCRLRRSAVAAAAAVDLFFFFQFSHLI